MALGDWRDHHWQDSLGAVFLSHYLRNPLQLIGLVLIVTIAMMLWSGVTTLTGQARESLERSQAALEPEVEILRRDGRPVAQSDFAVLRRDGLCVTPRLSVDLGSQPSLTLIGIDPLSAGCLQGESTGLVPAEITTGLLEPRLWGNAEALESWRAMPLSDAREGPVQLMADPVLPAETLVGDLAVIARYRDLGKASLQLLSPPVEPEDLPPQYHAAVRDYGIASDDLAASFLLNLDALGVLALLVAALLVRSVYIFGLSQREQTLRVLRQAGVPPSTVTLALAVELLLVGLLGGSLGLILGGEIAGIFSSGVRATLAGLFSAHAGALVVPGPVIWLQSALVLLAVIFWACGDQVWRSGGGAWPIRVTSVWRELTALGMALAGFMLTWMGETLWQVYAGAGLSLAGLAICLPRLIVAGLGFLQQYATDPLLEWSLSEMRGLARSMTLPLIALAFAIAATIGVYSMVTSFETTFEQWLDQRLQGDLYLEPAAGGTNEGPDAIREWTTALQSQDEVEQVHPVVRGKGLVGGRAVDVVGVDPESPLLQGWRFLTAVPQPWRRLARGRGVLINEQLARRDGLVVGETVHLTLGDRRMDARVLAVYTDYGRPAGEVLLPLASLDSTLPGHSLSFALTMASNDPDRWRALLESSGWPPIASHRNQQEIRQLAEAAFSRTFAITQALSSLTLALSGLAMALIGYATFRVRRPLYTLVHVFGLSVRQVRRRLIAHAAGLAALLAVLAIPLGIFLSWVLVARINPLAFGWALPFDLYPGFWLTIGGASAVLGAFVGLLMGNPVRLGHLQGGAALLLMTVVIAGCGSSDTPETTAGFASLGSATGRFAQPRPGMVIDLPADMGTHPAYRLEWWYLTANLESEDGRRFGVQWTLFRQSLRPPASHRQRTAWGTNEVWMAHAALSRPDRHYFAEKLARGGTGQAGVEITPFHAWLDDWRMVAVDGPADFEVQAATDEFRYRLQLQRTGETVAHGIDGFSAKSPSGQGSMYFSFPDLRVSGEISVGNDTFQVQGQGWFDREWSSQLLKSSQRGWDWFSIHLDSGAKLMVFQLRGDRPYYAGTFIGADGSVTPLAPEQIILEPQQRRTTPRGDIPVAWRLKIPSRQMDLRIKSWPGDHWNNGAFPYWEGPISVSGTHEGEGFLEMTGYARQ